MLKAIRIILEQQLPNYRKRASYLVKESLPMPPYSSVIGMIHFACGFTEYHPMKVSIQGTYASDIADLATLYNFGIKYDATRHQAKVKNASGSYDGINRGVRSVHLLTDVRLILHIVPENEEDFDTILQGVMYPKKYLSLGRHEDIVRVESVDVVELVEYDEDIHMEYDLSAGNYLYIPVEQVVDKESINGTIYHLTKKYSIHSKTNIREWEEVVKAYYTKSDDFSLSQAYVDSYYLVCLA